jgi:hypothetical protein
MEVTQFKGIYVLHTEFNWLPLNCLSKHIFVVVYTVISEEGREQPPTFPRFSLMIRVGNKIFYVAKLDAVCIRDVGTR